MGFTLQAPLQNFPIPCELMHDCISRSCSISVGWHPTPQKLQSYGSGKEFHKQPGAGRGGHGVRMLGVLRCRITGIKCFRLGGLEVWDFGV